MRWSEEARMSGRSTTLISYEPPNDTGDNDQDQDRDPGQLAKLQEKASSQLLQEFPRVSRSFFKCSKVSRIFFKCSKTLLITTHTGSSSGETERSSAAKHSSQRGRGEGERPLEEGGAGEQRHHGGQVQLSSIIFFSSSKKWFPTIHVGKTEFLFESPAKWARICHCRPDWYHCLRCESSFAFATLIGLVEEIKVQVCSYMVDGSEFITEPTLTQFTFPAWSTSTGWTGARATGCAGNQDWSVDHFSSSQISHIGLVRIDQ